MRAGPSSGDQVSRTLLTLAEHLSLPNQPLMTDWRLQPEIVTHIFGTRGTPAVDILPQSTVPTSTSSVCGPPSHHPYCRDLLSQPGFASDGKSYHMHEWRLSCSTTKQVASLTGLQEKKLLPRTIKGFRCCLASVLNRMGKTAAIKDKAL